MDICFNVLWTYKLIKDLVIPSKSSKLLLNMYLQCVVHLKRHDKKYKMECRSYTFGKEMTNIVHNGN